MVQQAKENIPVFTELDIDFVNEFEKLDFGEFGSDFKYMWYILTRNVQLLEQDDLISIIGKMYFFSKEFNVDRQLIESINKTFKI